MEQAELRVHICLGIHCTANGSPATLDAFEQAVRERAVEGRVEIIAATCRDRCDYGPSVNVYPGFHTYCRVQPHDAAAILEDRLGGGSTARSLLCEPWMRRTT